MAAFDETLCGCMDDYFSCLVSFNGSAPCIVAQAEDKALSSGFCTPCLLSTFACCIGVAMSRGKVREKYNIEGNFVGDLLISWCCGPCVAAQMWREVKRREGGL